MQIIRTGRGAQRRGRTRTRAIAVLAIAVVAAALSSVVAFSQIVGTPNQGHLIEVGPTSGANGFPVWYKDDTADANGKARRLSLCLDKDDPMCGFLPGDVPDESKPVSFPDNWPEELFYMLASSTIDLPGGGRLVSTFGLEATFANGEPVDGDQITFGRIRFVGRGLTPDTTYTITHPYGVDQLTTDSAGALKYVQDVGVAPGVFTGALSSRLGPFLRWDADAPAGYLGNPAVEHTITGSPNSTNFVKLEQGAGGSRSLVAQNDLFTVQGKYATNGGVNVTAVAYNRDSGASGGGTIDVFADSEQDAQSIEVSGQGFDPVLMHGTNGHYQARVAYTGPKPATIKVTNVSDVPADAKTVPVGDRITGTAVYDVDAKELTIDARSSDASAPPALTAAGYGALDGNGTLVVEDVEGVPSAITVTSPKEYGGSASIPVQLAGHAYAPIPVVAFAGPDERAVAGRTVTLDATGSTGPVKTFAWKQTAGPDVGVTGSTAARATFTAPDVTADTTLTFEVTVNGSVKDSVDVVVLASAPAVKADAGTDQTVAQDTTVTLDASLTENATKLAWRQSAGPTVALNTADPVHPTFRMPKGTAALTFELTATGAAGDATAKVVVTPKPDVLDTSLVEYRTSKREWRITGTSDVSGPGVSVTIRNGSASGPVLNVAGVDTLGAWQFRGAGAAPTTDRTVTLQSSSGGTKVVTVAVRS